MQNLTVAGTIGKDIVVEQMENSVKFSYSLNANELRKKNDGTTTQTNTLVFVTTYKTKGIEEFEQKIKPGASVLITGTTTPEFVKKEGKQFTAFRIKYTREVLFCDKIDNFLKLEQIGYIGSVRVNAEGPDKVCNFSLAHNEPVKNNEDTLTIWTNCALWKAPDKTKIFAYIEKGKLVYISGYPRVGTYATGTGETNLSLDCNINTIELLSASTNKALQEAFIPDIPVEQENESLDDDLPF